jgi:hypothetical protein
MSSKDITEASPQVPKARKASESALIFPDGTLLRIRIWEVPESVPPSEHRFKYSCFYGRPGERAVLYDNERGKGDHRNYGEREEPYRFTTIEDLIADFLRDVRRVRGEDG